MIGSRVETTTVLQRCGLTVLWLYLVAPLLIQAAMGGLREFTDVLSLMMTAVSLLWVAVGHFSVRRPFLLHLALAPLYVTTTLDLFILNTFGARLTSGYVNVALSNRPDTSEFLWTYLRPELLVLIAFLIIYPTGLYLVRGMRTASSPRLALVAASAIAGIYGLALSHFMIADKNLKSTFLDLAAHETSVPLGVIFQTGVALNIHGEFREAIAHRAGYKFGASKPASAEDEIYVWVVGESARAANWSLFGYARDTSPRLRSTPGIIAFPDMMTTAPHTSMAVPSMLSLQSISNWQQVLAEKSVVSAFNEAGFTTYWLSTQDADEFAGIIPQIASEAAKVRYFNQTYDGVFVDQVRTILRNAPWGSGCRILIVLHTKGSHFDYARRYPSDFAHFGTPHGTRRDKIIDTYDNSILYTDWVLASLIGLLSERGSISALLYASDHGENLLDDSRQLLGHAMGTKYDLSSAAFLWLSGELRQRHPDWVANAERNSKAPLSLSNLPHSMLELAGIQAPALNPRMSVFDPGFATETRFQFVRGELLQETDAPGTNR